MSLFSTRRRTRPNPDPPQRICASHIYFGSKIATYTYYKDHLPIKNCTATRLMPTKKLKLHILTYIKPELPETIIGRELLSLWVVATRVIFYKNYLKMINPQWHKLEPDKLGHDYYAWIPHAQERVSFLWGKAKWKYEMLKTRTSLWIHHLNY